MREAIECQGSPRDMGLDQGEAFRNAVRRRMARARSARSRPTRDVSTGFRWSGFLRALLSGRSLGAGRGREILRHYAHQVERASGIALAAGVSLESLMEVLLEDAAHWDPEDSPRSGSLCLASSSGGKGSARDPARIAGTLPSPSGRGALSGSSAAPESTLEVGWILRRSRPEVGFRSVELALPWSVAAVAGVNDRGLAASLASGGDFDSSTGGGPTPALLLQECLQRFEAVDAGLDWCLKRPGVGWGSVVLADEAGSVGAVVLNGSQRRVLRAVDGLLVAGASPDQETQLRKQFLADSDLAACLSPSHDGEPHAAWVDFGLSRRQLSCRERAGGVWQTRGPFSA